MNHPFLTPGLHHMLILHDNTCPGANGDPLNCVCEPDIVRTQDTAYVERVMARNRTERRAAEREAEKALRKARKTGGSKK